MSNLDNIVQVNITTDTTGLATANFETGMLISNQAVQRVKSYLSLSEVAADYSSTSDEYYAAAAYFNQERRPKNLIIGGHSHVLESDFGAGTYTAGDIKAYVNGTEITEAFDTDKATTLTNLAASIQAESAVATAVYATNKITITPAADTFVFVRYDLSGITGTMDVTTVGTTEQETISEALDEILNVNTSWYGFSLLSALPADIVSAGSWAISNKKFQFAASADANIKDQDSVTDTTSVAYLLNNAGNPKTALTYNDEARTAVSGSEALGFIDSGFMSNLLARVPGSYTAEFKTIVGASADDLTGNQTSNITAKNTVFYNTVAGVNVTQNTRVTDGNAKGEWIDTIIGIDWLEARIQEAVFLAKVNNGKIPYTNVGAAIIEGAVDSVLAQAVENGFLSEYETSIEPVEDQSQQDRIDRKYDGCSFSAVLAGAIHTTIINGTVRV